MLEADLMRSEAKVAALAHPSTASLTYKRGPNGEIYPEDPHEAPQSKEDGAERWRKEMTLRFLKGLDDDFEYDSVDDNEDWDDRVQEEREEQEKFFDEEEPRWVLHDDDEAESHHPPRAVAVTGETGVQDF